MNIGASDYGAKKAMMRVVGFRGQEVAHQRHRTRAQEDGSAGRHRHRYAAVGRGTGARPGHHRRHDFRPVGVRRLQDERPAQGRSPSPTIPTSSRLPSSANRGSTRCRPICRRSSFKPARTRRTKTQQWEYRLHQKPGGNWTKLGGTVHTLPDDDLAKMKTLLAPVARPGHQGSAGGARHAANGAVGGRHAHEAGQSKAPRKPSP